jgi:hypothetical protein
VSGNVLASGSKTEFNPISGGGMRGLNIAGGTAAIELVYVRGP